MGFFVVYFKDTTGKLETKETFNTEQDARDNLEKLALDYIGSEDNEVNITLQNDKLIEEIRTDSTFEDGYYLKYDSNDDNVLNLYQKITVVSEGTFYNSYEIKMVNLGYYSTAFIKADANKIVENTIEEKIETNDYQSLLKYLDLFSGDVSTEVDTGIDQFLTGIVTKRIEQGKDGLLLGLLSLIKDNIDRQILKVELGLVKRKKEVDTSSKEHNSLCYNNVMDEIKTMNGIFGLNRVHKHPSLAPPVPPRPNKFASVTDEDLKVQVDPNYSICPNSRYTYYEYDYEDYDISNDRDSEDFYHNPYEYVDSYNDAQYDDFYNNYDYPVEQISMNNDIYYDNNSEQHYHVVANTCPHLADESLEDFQKKLVECVGKQLHNQL
jgi:hypothetical protein